MSCLTKSSFSFSSASRVLNRFCTSLINRNAVLRFDDGDDSSPGSLMFVLRYVLTIYYMPQRKERVIKKLKHIKRKKRTN